ncbi:MAG: YdcF family protein [Nanoarchaeota archaeon]|nr:YdcF family protein [Nanoarchaeota archaeon]
MKADLIIVLGNGITPEGMLPDDARLRVEKGVKLYKKGKASKMLMTGQSSFKLKKRPALTEAKIMSLYARALGVPAKDIFLEEESRETIGNAYFSRRLIGKKDYNKLIVVTSRYHMARSKFFFNKVFGSDFKIKVVGSKSKMGFRKHSKQVLHEVEDIAKMQMRLLNVRDGDLERIKKELKTFPWYKNIKL